MSIEQKRCLKEKVRQFGQKMATIEQVVAARSGNNATASEERVVTDGRPISGRVWKKKQKRTSKRKDDNSRKSLWEQKMLAKAKYKQMKEYEREVIERRKELIQSRNEKALAKRKRKAEAELKNSKWQVVTNDKKIKKMSKKQLRLVKRMRMNPQLGVPEFVNAYQR